MFVCDSDGNDIVTPPPRLVGSLALQVSVADYLHKKTELMKKLHQNLFTITSFAIMLISPGALTYSLTTHCTAARS